MVRYPKRKESILVKYVLFLICCVPCFLAKAGEITVIGSIHSPTASYTSSDLADYISMLDPDVILTEGDESMFNSEGRVSDEASGLEVDAYRQTQQSSQIPIINVSMERRNQEMRKVKYNQTLGQVFQVVQGKYKSGELANSALFEEILGTFSARSRCMQNSTFEELQSEKCVDAFKENSDAIFKDMHNLLKSDPDLSVELERWEPLVTFHKKRHSEMVANVTSHICKDTNKKYLLIVGVLHFSEVRKLLSNTDCEFKLNSYSGAPN